ncbi:hypothetical protein SLEP1_g24036 [Rubroshorea leprosula]|uniref:Uncharacterized protein n=1 Tax=Rubroshorea leprosula TaxID=152421 RepID=A0AAV5JEA9_9ROSI|nr:hypothetical protein SLEP1_g24036 [Rubroshorea leprosula]
MMEAGSSNTKGSDAAELVQVITDVPEPPPSVNTDSGYAIDVKVILDSKEDICENKELSSLVKECLENRRQILAVFEDLQICLKRARKKQKIVQRAVQKFEKEVLDGGEERNFGKTLDEPNKFTAAEKPFEGDFSGRFSSVRDKRVSLLEKLLQQKEVVDKNLKSVKTWRKVSNILFVTLFVSTAVFSVVAAAIASSPVVTSVASTLVVSVASLGKWCSWLLNRYEKKLEWQKELLTMESVTGDLTIKGTEKIRVLLNDANSALGGQQPVEGVIDERRKKLEEFKKTIKELGKEAAKCHQGIQKATTLILEKITNPSPQFFLLPFALPPATLPKAPKIF